MSRGPRIRPCAGQVAGAACGAAAGPAARGLPAAAAALLAILAGACARPFPSGWVYVTRVDATAASIVWTGAAPASAACRGPDGTPVRADATRGARGVRTARLEGLRPDTRYACRLLDAGGGTASRLSFRTAPPGPDSSVLFTVVGDSGHGGPVARAIARRIRAAHPAFLIHVGDFAYGHGTVQQMRGQFFAPYRDTLRRVPLFPTPGNHDLFNRSIYRTLFAPAAAGTEGDGLGYRFAWGPAAFASFSSPQAAGGGAQVAAALAAGNAPWRIVFLHEPLYTAGWKRVAAGLRPTFGPLVEGAGIDLVLAGHQHFYERSEPSCEFVPSARVTHVTSGGGSATHLDPVRAHPNFPRALSAAHFLRVRVRPDRIAIRAVDPDGRTLDRWVRWRDVDPGCRAGGWPRQHGRES